MTIHVIVLIIKEINIIKYLRKSDANPQNNEKRTQM